MSAEYDAALEIKAAIDNLAREVDLLRDRVGIYVGLFASWLMDTMPKGSHSRTLATELLSQIDKLGAQGGGKQVDPLGMDP
jgi:hypothetical protein